MILINRGISSFLETTSMTKIICLITHFINFSMVKQNIKLEDPVIFHIKKIILLTAPFRMKI